MKKTWLSSRIIGDSVLTLRCWPLQRLKEPEITELWQPKDPPHLVNKKIALFHSVWVIQ